ncbi:lipopolysaccharide biosynthesis protein [Sulfurihydrogenibium sp.]|uniref:lipopolysaccharide biosynthesis protein n=1 Tax=Sulfurihydrogenibium sp. TaxID=2053621 RepID=UPI003D12015B
MINSFLYLSLMFFYVNILGYIFHFVVSRKLGPEGYGEFMVLYSFMLILGYFSNVFPTVVIKGVLENDTEKYSILRFFRLIAVLIGFVIFLIILAFSGFIKNFLHVSDVYSILTVSLISLIIFLEKVEKGFLQAVNKFGLYSFYNAGELTLRLFFAVILINLGFGINGAISSTFFSLSISLILLLWTNKNIFGNIKKIPIKGVLKSLLLTTPTGLFVYADDLFIKRVFEPVLAGYFASASIVGKAYIWFILTIFSVVFVKITENKKDYRKYIYYFLGFVIFSFLSAEIVIYFVGEKFFILLFGSKFAKAFSILPIYLVTIIPLLINVILYFMNVSLEKTFLGMYIHLIAYYLGFVLIKFQSIEDYLIYIFTLNLLFMFINLYVFLKQFPNIHTQKTQR